MQCVADDLCDGAVMGKHDVGHAGEVLVEKASQNARFQRFHECRETGDVREQRCDFSALSVELDRARFVRKLLRQVG